MATVKACFNLLRKGITARDVMTRKAFENAIVVLYSVHQDSSLCADSLSDLCC